MARQAVVVVEADVTLRAYQQDASDAAIEWMRRSVEPACIEAVTAAGKSHVIADMALRIHDMTGKRILCLAPSAELVQQNREKFLATGNPASMFSASAGAKDLSHPVVFGSPLTVKNRISRFTDGYAMVVLDECFTGDTIISTPRGEKPINSLRNGDIVCNAVGSGEVETVFTKSISEIYLVKLTNGTTIRCTGNHPFFTEDGWVQASQLEGKSVFRKEDVSSLLNDFRAEVVSNEKARRDASPDNAPDDRGKLEQARNLFAILRKEMEEPHAQCFVTPEGGGDLEAHRAQAASDLGKWTWPNCSAKVSSGHFGIGLGSGASHSDWGWSQEWNVPKCIQGGPCLSTEDDCLGSGRGEPRHSCATSRRQKERCAFGSIGVESVSRVKLESPEIVYNLHISGHPSYFAGGVLVHNCHGISPTVRGIIEEMRAGNPNLRIIGLTATPYRMGSGYIFRQWPDGKVNDDSRAREPYFTKCVYRITGPDLIAQGFLTRPVISETGAEHYDTAGLCLNSRGQFDAAAVDRAYHGHGRKTAAIVADVVARSQGRQGVMLFAATVRHAEEVMASLPPHLSALVTGETPKGERASILRRFKARRIKYLVNVAVLTTGFDAPHVDCIAILRKTESVGLLQQIIGRGLRLDEGKKDCIVLDYTDNLETHCPDGDIFAPEVRAGKGGGDSEGLRCECPDCGYENRFPAKPDMLEYDKDANGYCLDLAGHRVETEWGPMPGHFGRRCWGMVQAPGGKLDRCGYRWTSKECKECSAPNDIAARYCTECKSEIVDPNDKLRMEFTAMKRDPMQPQCDEVIEARFVEGVSQRGATTIRAEWTTPYRKLTTWHMPHAPHAKGRRDWERFAAATEDGTRPPKSISYVKEPSGFYRALAFNMEPDLAP